jgi:pimeloyl-ACP methyl ester carboxylesterase
MHNTKKIKIKDAELNYIEKGKGAHVLFVHGSLNDYRTWKLQMEPFSEKFHIIAYSRRYHYPNKWEKYNKLYSAVNEADDMSELLDKLGLNNVNIVGSSYGAYSAIYLAIKRPKLVKTLTLSEPPVITWLKDIEGGMEYYDYFVNNAWLAAAEAFRNNAYEEGIRLFINGVSGAGYYESLSPRSKSLLMDNAEELKLETLSEEIFPELKCEELKNVKIPVLMLKGESSPIYFRMIADKMNTCFFNSNIQTIPGATHGKHLQNPDHYNRTVINFLLKHNYPD